MNKDISYPIFFHIMLKMIWLCIETKVQVGLQLARLKSVGVVQPMEGRVGHVPPNFVRYDIVP